MLAFIKEGLECMRWFSRVCVTANPKFPLRRDCPATSRSTSTLPIKISSLATPGPYPYQKERREAEKSRDSHQGCDRAWQKMGEGVQEYWGRGAGEKCRESFLNKTWISSCPRAPAPVHSGSFLTSPSSPAEVFT